MILARSLDCSQFIKINQPSSVSIFRAEAKGLRELRKLRYVRVPKVISCGQTDDHSYLAMEYIKLGSLCSQSSHKLGCQLAQLHLHQQDFFGWYIDNAIGSTSQHNNRGHNWGHFWQQQRLNKQLQFDISLIYSLKCN